MIAVPNLGTMDTRLVMKLLRWSIMPQNWESVTILAPIGQIPHDSARNYCVEQFLQTDNTHLLFLDDDVVPPVYALGRLLEADKPVISGLYPIQWANPATGSMGTRQSVFSDVLSNGELVEAKGEGVQLIQSCGGGCLLIRRDVLETIKAPWFKFHYNERGLMNLGEDVDFCRKLKDANIPLYAHFDVQCNHVKTIML